ncbi:MAG: proline--tRNA ligase [Anaerolineae bacterium]|mgnify:CR=1 FL=1|jgi:prolyl-tRNA synthetase|nr:proline--tRNA ligase [Anaerolineae bacterium]MBT4312655.1 proline--tRNA ligase [Anaerolineae bacterium]MBT4459398.1 proline--tRNA ligase [Anaerolineae bacterium]MBT6061064.1 proline--tRNA ligase [Anaerolineae bacterium]MBT6322965.1 proline--tRNA ligase [Anaerolineae bacterium]
MADEKLTPQSENFSDWYNQLVLRAELADYAPVRGCMVVRPYGWTLWENMQAGLDRRFKETGHVNAAFPTLIPMSFFEKEKEHVEGFSPELAVVTHGGGKELEEKLAIRPTSETIIGHMYSKWVQSWRDLPILINQWGSVMRWELRTKLFLRTAEFYWQEGHTAHTTADEAKEETYRMLDVYADFAETDCAIPVVKGYKSDTERFAGAQMTTGIEAMMRDTKALQSGTSHYFGQNFAIAFDIDFLNKDNELEHAYTTSWGMSTRMIGALIMVHGDDQGMKMPPKIAPIQVVIVPIYRKNAEKEKVMVAVDEVFAELKEGGIRVKVDDREGFSPGFKYNDWELRGVPLRIEIGPRDVKKESVALARRDVPGRDGKTFEPRVGLLDTVVDRLDSIQTAMFEAAKKFRDDNIHDPAYYDELKEVVQKGWALSWWCESAECEAKVKEDTKATTRVIPLEQDQPGGEGKCIVCGEKAEKKVYFAKAY